MKLFRKIKYGIQNLIYYFPIIWKDRDWDWTFLCQLLERKIQSMEHYYRIYSMGTNREKEAKKIKICQLLLERLSGEKWDYFCNHKSFGLFQNSLDYEDYMRLQDLSLFCKILQKNLFCWWD